MVQIVALTGTLADTGEDRVTTVGLGDVVDQLLDEDGLADTSTTEQTDLTTTGVGGEEIDDLDTSDQNLSGGGLLGELGRVGVDGEELVGLDGSTLVDGVTSDVHDTSQGSRADGDGDGSAGVGSLGATDETLGTCPSISNKATYGRAARHLPSIAMQRTTFSPRCCYSRVSFGVSLGACRVGADVPRPRGQACCPGCLSGGRSELEGAWPCRISLQRNQQLALAKKKREAQVEPSDVVD